MRAIVLILCLSLSADTLLQMADYLYKNRAFDQAITEYKRFLFFHPDFPLKAELEYKIALCYRQLGQEERALTYFQKAIYHAKGRKLRQEILLSASALLIKKGELEQARMLLRPVFSSPAEKEQREKAALLLGISYIKEYRWHMASHYLAHVLEPEENPELFQLLRRAVRKPGPSPEKAVKLSQLLPGLGQLYAGYPDMALSSLLVNIATLSLLSSALIHREVLSAMLIYFPLFRRYYLGSSYGAARLAERRHKREMERFARQALQLIYEKLCPSCKTQR